MPEELNVICSTSPRGSDCVTSVCARAPPRLAPKYGPVQLKADDAIAAGRTTDRSAALAGRTATSALIAMATYNSRFMLPILYGALTLLLLYNITDWTSVTIRQRFQMSIRRSRSGSKTDHPFVHHVAPEHENAEDHDQYRRH